MSNNQEILKKLALDFAKYDYYGDLFVYRVDKKSGDTKRFDIKDGWVETEYNVAERAKNIFDGGMDIDIFLKDDEDYIVETALGINEDEE